MTKELLFSVTAADCDWSYTRGTGKGGQKKNKTSSAVHCTHRASKAHAYSEASRSQLDNRRDAFKKMAATPEFQKWLKLETARRQGTLMEVEQKVENEMRKIVVEVKDPAGKWTRVDKDDELND